MGVWSKQHVAESIKWLARNGPKKGDFYEFGCYRGETTAMMSNLADTNGIEARKIFAFDSFEGLPDEEAGIPCFYIFTRGAFSDVHFLYPVRRALFIKRWFKDLTAEDVTKYDMRKANLVHIDCDLCISARQSLDFLFSNNLIQPGTVICFDEFKSTEPLWAGGEAKAHREIADKYKVKFREFFRNIYMDSMPCWQNSFVVESIGEESGHGVNNESNEPIPYE